MKARGIELLRVVLEDLTYLTWWSGTNPSDDEIRRASPVVRRLLVENDLRQSWKLCGFEREPKVRFVGSTADGNDEPGLVFRQDAMVNTGIGQIGAVKIYNRALTDEEIRKHYETEREAITQPGRLVGLSHFLDTPAVVIKGERKTRRQLIKYVANKRGGAHFDTRDRDKNLDETSAQLMIAEHDPVLLNLLGIIQSVVSSEDVKSLMTTISQNLAH